ncbi:MAG: uroporphyrinogen-III synthase [Bacteroidales bacterium]|nr:MAG: uroporphyrinogen-III synthase [Bacteroidales bacterium]
MKIKKILVSQPEPENEKSPYHELARKNGLKIDFRPFIHVEGVSAKEFRQARIDILDHSALIFTSKTAIDHFFRISEEMRSTIPDSMKYFCVSESVAFYLQKYIVYRKRKIFYGHNNFSGLMDLILKHKDEKFLVPLSDQHKPEIPELLNKNKIDYTIGILYKTVCSDLSDLSEVDYDILVFFSPSGIKSLKQNFPDFKQNTTKIAAFGPTTIKAVKDAGLRLDIAAPNPKAPSMTMALEQYITEFNKNN